MLTECSTSIQELPLNRAACSARRGGLISAISCTGNQNGSKKNNTEPTIKQNVDSVNPAVKKKKSDDRNPKVLTYTEIVKRYEKMMKYYEELKKYSNTDSIDRKIWLNQSFYNELTTQLKYMLSSELRLLRNEFFARKGYKFKSDDFNDYFSEYDWYRFIFQLHGFQVNRI